MKNLRRELLEELLQLEDGRILASSPSGDRYWLVDDEAGTSESISVQAAALLWQRHGVAGRERLERRKDDTSSDSLFGAQPQPDESGKSFSERLRERLTMLEDE